MTVIPKSAWGRVRVLTKPLGDLSPDRNLRLFLCSFFFKSQEAAMYFVYIIYSEKHDKYYKGFSENPPKRLAQHNNGESRYTQHFTPWILVYSEQLPDKTTALKREIVLKKYAKSQILELIKSQKNILNTK